MNPEAPRALTLDVAGLRWRVLRAGQGPVLLLLHGTGSSSASWGGCAAALAERFCVVMPDLPGHGGTAAWPDRQANLPRMAAAVGGLLRALGIEPALAAGHSAGAAVMLQMALDGGIAPQGLLSLNGALTPLQGLAGRVFPPLARWMARTPGLPSLVARRAAHPHALARLIHGTGSRLGAAQVEHYRQLLTQPSHIHGTLDMLAGWNLVELEAALPNLRIPLWLVAGLNDRTVPPDQSRQWAARLPQASFHALPGLGHLAHEESPARVVALIEALWAQVAKPDMAPDTAL
jgi:magnesium chelatase accessory protein